MKTIKFFYDLETTGLDSRTCGIHQIGGLIEVNGEAVEEFDWKIKPFEGCEIQPGALLTCDVTKEQLMGYPDSEKTVHRRLLLTLSKYIDKFDRKDKAYKVGYNIAHFDDAFMEAWFLRCKDPYLMSWFWSGSLDVMILASEALIQYRKELPNFKLATVAKALGIDTESGKLHDASFDNQITREVYQTICGYDL